MRCPVCKDVDLVMSERSGVEIDYCPSCRGVWLDRGELDKIIERSTTTTNSRQNEYFDSKREYEPRKDDRRYDDKRYYDDGYHNGYRRKKKESFLSELFDF
ncbi:putative transcriptional regulator (zinc finger domain protein) [Campylobacter vicugnae]|uniref:Transcriptional regulator (Zinc finger domain protein) n=1 Tax=Campylobacter vicugnae TaxID=1660076 RepID=A0A1X9T204_9BACT|nr:zf-TFIIB domain-containing protein [Campylobacter sp. RM8964]ARR02564.1 putative transcriptional regulator (zinc finger domain protein) [Campylobacter sp. RM8964]